MNKSQARGTTSQHGVLRKTTDPATPTAAIANPIIRKIAVRLEAHYHSPRLGNPTDPLDDLVFLVLSGRTTYRIHERAYQALRSAFPSWADAHRNGADAIQEIVSEAGFGQKRGQHIWEILDHVVSAYGALTLDALKGMDDISAEAFLTGLPGVGVKTARCVMTYTLGRRMFPVDVHVKRILARFGLVNPRVRLEYAQDALQAIVPEELRYSLHVNLVAHGREICRPRKPRCTSCPISDFCLDCESSSGA